MTFVCGELYVRLSSAAQGAVPSAYHSEEEEQGCGMLLAHSLCIADGGVAGVLDGSVRADVADGGVRGVLHCPVAADVADGGVRGVLDGAVVSDVTHRGVGGVLHDSVISDVAHRGVAGIVHCPVLHVADGGVGAVLHCLGLHRRRAQQHDEHQGDFCNYFHRLSVFWGLIMSMDLSCLFVQI